MKKSYKQILKEHDFLTHFNPQSLKLQENMIDLGYRGRKDLRDTHTMTIDAHNTVDFDDAFSILPKKEGQIHLMVHIADIYHYVQYNQQLFLDAKEKGRSLYLKHAQYPMLPEVITQELGSLKNDKKDKVAITFEFLLDEQTGKVTHFDFYESIIQINYNYTFEKFIKNKAYYFGNDTNPISWYWDAVRIGAILKKHRLNEQLLNEEQSTALDDVRRSPMYRFIKEIGILVNENIAKYFHEKEIPFVYRSQSGMPKHNFRRFKQIIKKRKIKLDRIDLSLSGIKTLIEKLDKEEEEEILRFLSENMSHAMYRPLAKSHVSMGVESYSHVTAPMRRFSDLFNQKIIKHYLKGNTQQDALLHILNKQTIAVSREMRANHFKVLQIKDDIEELEEQIERDKEMANIKKLEEEQKKEEIAKEMMEATTLHALYPLQLTIP